MCVDTNAISKNLAYKLYRTPNNAQNTQQKLGIAFSYLERKYGMKHTELLIHLIQGVRLPWDPLYTGFTVFLHEGWGVTWLQTAKTNKLWDNQEKT